uniref:Uncharacterized protein n=1 Tax=Arundo donax TaxID=35708 RepID=A0A0A8ZR44_ARUDO
MCRYRRGAAIGAVLIGWTRRRSGCTTTSSTLTCTTLDRTAPTILPLRCVSSGNDL